MRPPKGTIISIVYMFGDPNQCEPVEAGGEVHYDKIRINDSWSERKDFRENFMPIFCVKVHKYQGCDIDDHYNIFEINRMDKKQLYTALSKTKYLDYIHLDDSKINNGYFPRWQPDLGITNSRFNSFNVQKCPDIR